MFAAKFCYIDKVQSKSGGAEFNETGIEEGEPCNPVLFEQVIQDTVPGRLQLCQRNFAVDTHIEKSKRGKGKFP